MDATTKGRLSCLFRNKGSGGVSQSSENDVWSEIKGAGAQKLKCCEEVILCGRSTWDLCAGRRTDIGGRKAFYDQAE